MCFLKIKKKNCHMIQFPSKKMLTATPVGPQRMDNEIIITTTITKRKLGKCNSGLHHTFFCCLCEIKRPNRLVYVQRPKLLKSYF